MIEFTYQVKDPNGIHARPAGKLATFAKQFRSDIQVKANGKKADAKRLLALMSLGAKAGDTLTFSIIGEDEETAAEQIKNHLEHSYGETT